MDLDAVKCVEKIKKSRQCIVRYTLLMCFNTLLGVVTVFNVKLTSISDYTYALVLCIFYALCMDTLHKAIAKCKKDRDYYLLTLRKLALRQAIEETCQGLN